MSPTPPRLAESRVFISYARDGGSGPAVDLFEKLQHAAIPAWMDREGMSGGQDWWLQIEAQLNRVDYMVLVLNRSALTSGTVQRECRYARQQGVVIFPVTIDDSVDHAELPRWLRRVHLYDLRKTEDESRLFVDLTKTPAKVRVPQMAEPPPVDYVARNAALRAIKAHFVAEESDDPIGGTVAIYGAGGFGKTTLARALCVDTDVNRAFDDGVLWVTLGTSPTDSELLARLHDLIEVLSGDRPKFAGIEAASTRLRELLGERYILLVIDDVWRSIDLGPFVSGGANCARLITTRRRDVVPRAGHIVDLAGMSHGEAMSLLASGLPAGPEESLLSIASDLGDWPLLLKLANSWLRRRVVDSHQNIGEALSTIRAALNTRGISAFDAKNTQERSEAVSKTLGLSFSELSPATQSRLMELAVFGRGVDISLTTLETYWKATADYDRLEVEECCLTLFRESLLVEFDLGRRIVRLHDSIRDWLCTQQWIPGLPERHRSLIEAYRALGGSWPDVPDDGYIHAHLARHLLASGQQLDLATLLLDPQWIRTLLCGPKEGLADQGGGDIFGVLRDFDLLPPTPDRVMVRRALQMSSHVLATSPGQVCRQLYGRLGAIPGEVGAMSEAAARLESSEALFPLRPSLRPPGPLLLTLAAHGDSVSGAILFPDNIRVLSWSDDQTLRVWNLARGELLGTLYGHGDVIIGATLIDRGRRAVSWSDDGSVRVWDTDVCLPIHQLLKHKSPVNGVAMLAEGKRALSWSDDGSLCLWDVAHGSLIRVLAGHVSRILGAIALAEERQVASWSDDGAIRIWQLESGDSVELRTDDARLDGFLLWRNGPLAVSWSRPGCVELWDLKRAERVRRLDVGLPDIAGVASLGHGNEVAFWSENNAISVWDVVDHRPRHHLSLACEYIVGLTLSPDARYAVVSTNEPGPLVLDLRADAVPIASPGYSAPLQGATFVDGTGQFVAWSADGRIHLSSATARVSGRRLPGHDAPVNGVLLIDGGRRVLSWSHDQTLRLWSLDPEEPAPEVADHGAAVRGAQADSEDGRLLTWSDDGTSKLWDIRSGTLEWTFKGGSAGLTVATLLPDGAVAAASDDRTIRVWIQRSEEPAQIFVGHDDTIRGLTALNGGRRLLSWADDGSLKVWDRAIAAEVAHLSGHEGEVLGATLLSEDAGLLTWADDRTLRIWDLERGRLVRTLRGHDRRVEGVLHLRNRGQALSWSADSTLRLWDLGRDSETCRLVGHDDSVRGALLLANDDVALSWSHDGTIRKWDLARGAMIDVFETGEPGGMHDRKAVVGVVVSEVLRRVLSWHADGMMRWWDLDTSRLLGSTMAHERSVLGAFLLEEGRRAVSWSDDHAVKLWELEDMHCAGMFVSDDVPLWARLMKRGTRVVVGDAGGHVHVLRTLGVEPTGLS